MNLSLLKKQNTHPRDKRIAFDEGPHIYYIDGDSSYTSVTTWVGSHFPHFNADKIINKMMKSKKWSKSKYFGQTKEEIKQLWSNTGKEACDLGTKLHYNIECFYNKNKITDDSVGYKQFLNFQEKIGQFMNPYRTEWTIFDEKLKIAGSIDMIFKNDDGTFTIYDWKRSKEIKKSNWFESATTHCINHLPASNFWKYSLQLNIYRTILERNYGITISKMCLLSLHPNQKNYQIHVVPFLKNEITDLVNIRLKDSQEEA
jgi:ATP-dependent exoDNAse (exonuclease V) beta subunit